MKKIILLVMFLFITAIVFAASTFTITKNEKCVERIVDYTEEEAVWSNVTKFKSQWEEQEEFSEENQSFSKRMVKVGEKAYTVLEVTGKQLVNKQKTVCDDSSTVEVVKNGKSIILDYLKNDFECVQASNGITCDSKLDGNGDGVCNSGESCYTILEEDGCVAIYQVNSLDTDTSIIKKTVNGECFKIYNDNSFKSKWDLLGGGSE